MGSKKENIELNGKELGHELSALLYAFKTLNDGIQKNSSVPEAIKKISTGILGRIEGVVKTVAIEVKKNKDEKPFLEEK